MKLPSSVQYDDLIRVHLAYFRHFNSKRALIGSNYELPVISALPTLNPPSVSEDKQLFYPSGGKYGQMVALIDAAANSKQQQSMLGKRSINQSPDKVGVQLRGEDSSSKSAKKKKLRSRDNKRLRKLKE